MAMAQWCRKIQFGFPNDNLQYSYSHSDGLFPHFHLSKCIILHLKQALAHDILLQVFYFNPIIALRKAEIICKFGLSECNRVKYPTSPIILHLKQALSHDILLQVFSFNPIAPRKVKIICKFGLSECNRVNYPTSVSILSSQTWCYICELIRMFSIITSPVHSWSF